jgi:hypothetical protein
VFIQHRLISRSSRSLAVMIGSGASAKGDGNESLRGSPEASAYLSGCPKVTIPRLLSRPIS